MHVDAPPAGCCRCRMPHAWCLCPSRTPSPSARWRCRLGTAPPGNSSAARCGQRGARLAGSATAASVALPRHPWPAHNTAMLLHAADGAGCLIQPATSPRGPHAWARQPPHQLALCLPCLPAPAAAFCCRRRSPAQVQTKLKLMGIEAIYLASSGERITRLDQLQDIDELYVVEVRWVVVVGVVHVCDAGVRACVCDGGVCVMVVRV